MNSAINFYHSNTSIEECVPQGINITILKFLIKNERKILKVFLLSRLHQLFFELFQNKIQNNFSMEYYTMDSKIIQFLIHDIVETGEYTLEGITRYTHIPFDVIYDAACGINNQFSIALWAKLVDLYLQLKPDIAQVLIDKLIEVKKRHHAAFSMLLNEP